MLRGIYFSETGRKKNGFTLIELLVVIAIIAILASILFPVFARARENARRSSCQSNLKQVALGMQQYVQDYDERLPFSYDQGETATPPRTPKAWHELMEPYLKSTQVLYCPSDAFAKSALPMTWDNVSYGYNWLYLDYYGNPARPGTYGNGCAMSRIAQTAQTVMIADAMNQASGGRYCIDWLTYRPSQKVHLEGANFSFIDGHVKWYPGSNSIFTSNELWDVD